MSEPFDAYHKWLAIPTSEQPPNHYRLLGLPLFEADREVISAGAVQRMNWVRKFRKGPQAATAERLTQEITSVWACLLNAERKQKYDELFRQQLHLPIPILPPVISSAEKLATTPSAVPLGDSTYINGTAPASPVSFPPDHADPFRLPSPTSSEVPIGVDVFARRPSKRRKQSDSAMLIKVIIGGLVGLIVGYAILLLIGPENDFLGLLPKAKKPTTQVANTNVSKPAPTIDNSNLPIVEPVSSSISSSQKPLAEENNPSSEQTIPKNIESVPDSQTPLAQAPAVAVEEPPTSASPETKNGVPADENKKIEPAVPKLLLPVPDEAAQGRAAKLIAEIYKPAYDSDKTPQQKDALAKKLLQDGKETSGDPAGRFVLLRTAREVAAKAADWKTAFEAADELGRDYEVDVLDMKTSILTTVAANSQHPFQFKALLDVIGVVLDDAVVSKRFDLSQRLADLGASTVKNSLGPVVTTVPEKRQAVTETVAAAYADGAIAFATLQKNPEDPQANSTAGKLLCIVRNRWDLGLPMLTLGSDEQLKALAGRDLKPPSSTDEEVAMADDWWDFSEKEIGLLHDAAKKRAAHWYRLALSDVKGLKKAAIEKRTANIPPDDLSDAHPGVKAEELGNPGQFPIPDSRRQIVLLNGGDESADSSIRNALEWLSRNQLPSGYWTLNGPYSNGGEAENETSATALALLAFQGAGDTQLTNGDDKHNYKQVVKKGWDALLKLQLGNGQFVTKNSPFYHQMYSHAQATIALCELYGMTHDPVYRSAAERAVNFCLSSQGDAGGWRYTPKTESDTSVTGWFVKALYSAKTAGLKVPDGTLQNVSRYLDSVQDEGGSSYRYQPNVAIDYAIAAEGLRCRQYLGWKRDDSRLVAGVEFLAKHPISNDDINVYYWYYATQLMYDMGGAYWKSWNEVLRKLLPETQVKNGPEAGSWDPAGDKYGAQGGRLYVTCLRILLLETYYREPSDHPDK